MSEEIAIKVENLTKSYRLYNSRTDRLKEALSPVRRKYHHDFYALRDLSFDVNKGETLGIIGKNGSGKSTLLKILTGVLTPTSGSVTVNGRMSALLELGAGFNPELTGLENVYFNGMLMGYSGEEMDAKLDDILSFADIGTFVNQPVKTYSSGMFVRLAFAVNISVDPDVLIIDEALSVGDVFFQQKCYKILDDLRKKGTTIVFVSHCMPDVMQFCQRVLFLDGGQNEYFGLAVKAVKRYFQRQHEKSVPNESSVISNEESMVVYSCGDQKFPWPQAQQYLDISGADVVSNGMASCVGVALCDENLISTKLFMQGSTAKLFCEFELMSVMDTPIGGFVIRNEKNVLVYGKSMMLYNDIDLPSIVLKGDIIRVMFDIELNLGPGEYTIDVGLSSVNKLEYDNRKYDSFQHLLAKASRICSLSNAANFTVAIRPFQNGEFEHLHIGICGLKSSYSISVLHNNALIKH